MQNQILSKTTAKIMNEQKIMCDDMINLNELQYSMQQLPLGKTPGLDGLPIKFCRTFWSIIKLDF